MGELRQFSTNKDTHMRKEKASNRAQGPGRRDDASGHGHSLPEPGTDVDAETEAEVEVEVEACRILIQCNPNLGSDQVTRIKQQAR